MKHIEPIANFMTHAPHTINSDLPIEMAQQMMKKYRVRHLPVQKAGHLVGIITERDLFLARSLDSEGKLLVEDVMTGEPYATSANTPLGEVVEKMATNLYGCAVVCDDRGHVVGIFTAIDGLREISDRLNLKDRKANIMKGSFV